MTMTISRLCAEWETKGSEVRENYSGKGVHPFNSGAIFFFRGTMIYFCAFTLMKKKKNSTPF